MRNFEFVEAAAEEEKYFEERKYFDNEDFREELIILEEENNRIEFSNLKGKFFEINSRGNIFVWNENILEDSKKNELNK